LRVKIPLARNEQLLKAGSVAWRHEQSRNALQCL